MVVLVSSTSINGAVIRGIVMLAAPILINRSMTNYCAGVSGKGNRINPRWRPNKKRNAHLSPRSRTNIYHLPASRPPLVSHWSLALISLSVCAGIQLLLGVPAARGERVRGTCGRLPYLRQDFHQRGKAQHPRSGTGTQEEFSF